MSQLDRDLLAPFREDPRLDGVRWLVADASGPSLQIVAYAHGPVSDHAMTLIRDVAEDAAKRAALRLRDVEVYEVSDEGGYFLITPDSLVLELPK